MPQALRQKANSDNREEAREMFYHAYDSYMIHAYPADELMPLSCRGRYRDPKNPRGHMDQALGNYTLTLIDAMDTLVVRANLHDSSELAHTATNID